MPKPYFTPKGERAEVRPTVYDKFVITFTGKPYDGQTGSGRAAVLAMIEPPMTVADLVNKAADAGYPSGYVVGSLLKHVQGAAEPAFKLDPPEGLTVEQAKARPARTPRDPEKAAQRAADAEAKAAKKAEREAGKAKREAERAEKKASREQRKAEIEADRAKRKHEKEQEAVKRAQDAEAAKQKAVEDAAARIADTSAANNGGTPAPVATPTVPRKGKRKTVVADAGASA